MVMIILSLDILNIYILLVNTQGVLSIFITFIFVYPKNTNILLKLTLNIFLSKIFLYNIDNILIQSSRRFLRYNNNLLEYSFINKAKIYIQKSIIKTIWIGQVYSSFLSHILMEHQNLNSKR